MAEQREQREERGRQSPERAGREGREMAQWRPFGDLESWLTPWEGLFPRRRFLDDMLRDFGGSRRSFVPAVELSENDESYTITVELPGVKKDDVHVDLREGMLVVQGEKRSEREEKKAPLLRRRHRRGCRGERRERRDRAPQLVHDDLQALARDPHAASPFPEDRSAIEASTRRAAARTAGSGSST